MTYSHKHQDRAVEDLLNELQELADQAMLRKCNLKLEHTTRKVAEATEAAYLFTIQRIKDTI